MANGLEPHDREPGNEGWTHPVDGVLGRSWTEQQAAWEDRMADVALGERYGPGYTEPPIDWAGPDDQQAGPAGQGPPAIEQLPPTTNPRMDGAARRTWPRLPGPVTRPLPCARWRPILRRASDRGGPAH